MNGNDLRVERVRLRVQQLDVAAEIGVTHQRVSAIESSQSVTPWWVNRYMTALAQLSRGSHTDHSQDTAA